VRYGWRKMEDREMDISLMDMGCLVSIVNLTDTHAGTCFVIVKWKQ